MSSDDLPIASPGSERSYHPSLRPRPLNFSRPRPVSINSAQKLVPDRQDSAVRGIKAFQEDENQADLPNEPRFSSDSQRTHTSGSTNSAASEFAWDGQLGELRSRRRPEEYERNQRYTRPSSARTGTTTSHSSHSTIAPDGGAGGSEEAILPPIAELPGSSGSMYPGSQPPRTRSIAATVDSDDSAPPPIPMKSPKIVKRTSVDQQSERLSMASSHTETTQRDWEDDTSHHTVSVYGDAAEAGAQDSSSSGALSSQGNNNKWSSSQYDTSGLSIAEIQKLRKKGINPALYAEMKAARKGKGKWIGPLVGNTYIG